MLNLKINKKRNNTGLLFLMLTPGLLYFIIFHYIPMSGLILAFKNFTVREGILGSAWVGWQNFKFLFLSGSMKRVVFNTIFYNIIFIITCDALAIIVAIFLAELPFKKVNKALHSIIFLPYFVSFVILGVFVYNLFNFEYGVVNSLLKHFKMEPVDIYNEPKYWTFIIVFFNAWKWIGYTSILYLATIVSINPKLYEAASIDGANIWQVIRYIILPSLVPTIIILTLLHLGQIMKGQFDLFYNLVGDNSLLFDQTDVIDTFVFRALVNNFDVGIGTATGLFQSVFGFMIILAANTIIRKIRPDYALF